MKKIDVSLVIPLLNEELNIPNLFDELKKFILSNNNNFTLELVFVDDGSTDNTISVIHSYAKTIDTSLKVIKLSKNFGSYNALRAGALHASGNIVTFAYADLQDPLSLIGEMFKKIIEKNDIVIAQRSTTKYGMFESLFSRCYAYTIRKIAIPDFPQNGFDVVMFNEKVKNYVNSNIESNTSITLQIIYSGFKKSFIKYDKDERKFGKSKWTLSKKIKLFIDSVVQYSYLPLRMISITGILLSILGFSWAAYLVILKIMGIGETKGWTALICLIAIGFGGVLIALGIIAEYLWRTLDAARNRPAFIIEEIFQNKKDDK